MDQGVVILLRRRTDGAYLMQQRDDKPGIAYPGHWALPGGGVNPGENPLAAAVRELKEETGYELGRNALVLIGKSPQELRGRKIERSIYLANYDGVQPIQCNEGQQMEFIHPNDFEPKGLNVFGDHKRFMDDAANFLSPRGKERGG